VPQLFVKNYLAERHLADRHLAGRHLAGRHLADTEHLDEAKGQNVILRTTENFEIECFMTFELALCHSVWHYGYF
jgi:hypothetical protein